MVLVHMLLPKSLVSNRYVQVCYIIGKSIDQAPTVTYLLVYTLLSNTLYSYMILYTLVDNGTGVMEASHVVAASAWIQVELNHVALQQKEMNNWIGPTVKHVWNDTLFALLILFGFVISTTAFHLSQQSIHLLLLESSMAQHTPEYWRKCVILYQKSEIILTFSFSFSEKCKRKKKRLNVIDREREYDR